MGSTPSPPALPDPYATASAQAQANTQTASANAFLNNPNVNNPYGSSTTTQTGSYTGSATLTRWERIPAAPRWV